MEFPFYRGDRYLHWDETLAWCRALAAAHPAWVAIEEIGTTLHERPIPLLTLGARDGDTDARPGFWLDGGTHCSEWTGVMAALYAASRWVEGLGAGDRALRAFFARNTVYVAPCMSPDGYDATRRGAPYLRSSLRPPRPGKPRRGLEPMDVDGDGRVLWMRWRHPGGPWVFDDPSGVRIRPRRIDDDPGDAWFVVSEGEWLDGDGRRLVSASLRHGVDLNRNFPSEWAPFEQFGMDSGAHALSEPESAAIVAAFRRRPRIAAALTNHTYTGALLTQPYRDPSPLDAVDVDLMEALGHDAVAGTGYRVMRVHPDFCYDPKKPVVGVWADTLAATFGVPGYTLELWDPYGAAGQTVKDPARFFLKPDPDVIAAVMAHFAQEPGAVFPWRAFDHPQLGAVEIGGFAYHTTVRNPPERLLAAECEKGFVVADRLRRSLPRVAVDVGAVRRGEVTVLEARLENHGYLPTTGLRRAQAIGAAPPVIVSLAAGEGVRIVSGDAAQDLGALDGWGTLLATSARHPLYPDLPSEGGTRAVASWVVGGSGVVEIRWDAGRGGRGVARVEIS